MPLQSKCVGNTSVIQHHKVKFFMELCWFSRWWKENSKHIQVLVTVLVRHCVLCREKLFLQLLTVAVLWLLSVWSFWAPELLLGIVGLTVKNKISALQSKKLPTRFSCFLLGGRNTGGRSRSAPVQPPDRPVRARPTSVPPGAVQDGLRIQPPQWPVAARSVHPLPRPGIACRKRWTPTPGPTHRGRTEEFKSVQNSKCYSAIWSWAFWCTTKETSRRRERFSIVGFGLISWKNNVKM